MGKEASGLTIEALAEQVEVPVRTIRFYIAEGLLPGPEGRGKAACYGEEHLLLLRLVRRLAEQRVPLAEQRERLARLSLKDLRALLAEEERRAAEWRRAREAPSAREYESMLLARARAGRGGLAESQADYAVPPPAQQAAPGRQPGAARPAGPLAEEWQRWELAPGVELHVRADVVAQRRKLIERLLQGARDWQCY
ncbi:MAG: MerR family transcriptional regulator [Chloroflexi bacterium]|nr:MerR family transcriptional regulator [Chloroflexota bacterium]